MAESRPTRSPWAPRWIIAATDITGICAFAVVAWRYPSFRMTGEQWLVALVMAALSAFIWARPLVLFRGNYSQGVQFDEGFLVVLLLLIPPLPTMVAFGGAVLLAQLVRRRPPVKSVFNLGLVLLSVAASIAVSRAVSAPQLHPDLIAVVGAAAGAALYFLLSTSLVSALLVSMGTTWRECLSPDLLAQTASSGAGALVGILLALDIGANRWAVALAVPLLAILRLLITAQFKAQHDRARMQGLFNLTLDANRRLRRETVIDSVLQAARTELRCPDAELTTVPPEAAQVAAPIEIAGEQNWLVVSGRRREEPFDEADRMLLDAIAAIAKGALTNAELYAQVRYERSRLASITLNIAEGVCAVDAAGDLTFVNPAAADLIQLPARRVAINDALAGDPLRAPDFLLEPARAVMETGGIVREEAWFHGRDGDPVQVAYTASAMRRNGEVAGAVIAFRDITEHKKLEQIMTHQALYDSLTGLANRRLLVERLERAIERSSVDGRAHALVFIDVDRFKAINDSLGHVTGDALLVAVGNRLCQAVGPSALVARFGGDEFVVLVEGVDDPDEAGAVARRIGTAVEEPLVLEDGYEIVASLSVGIALTEPGQSADDALRNADVAMYKAKERGGSYQFFDRQLMGTRSSERIDLEAALRKGIDRGELELFYQPLVSVADQSIVGAEALVRWRHPAEGLIGPDRFVPMAEETGLILPLGNLVLTQACEQIQAIRRRLGVNLPISVNLSPRQFQQSNLLADVATALDRAGLPSELLKIEITETMVMDDLGGATEIMKKLNRLGVKLAIDDFGTGHSSLGYLKNFPVHEVKVDRIFVSNLANDPVDLAIVKAVVDLADALGINAVAEGVETKEQLQGLKRLGCQMGQGYLFSRPLPAAAFDDLLDRHFRPAAPGSGRRGLRAV